MTLAGVPKNVEIVSKLFNTAVTFLARQCGELQLKEITIEYFKLNHHPVNPRQNQEWNYISYNGNLII